GAEPVTLEFSGIDDFHPDALYRRLELFQGLRETRRRMQDASTFAEAAAEFRTAAKQRIDVPQAGAASADKPQTDEQDTDTFSRLLGGNPGTAPQAARTGAQPTLDLS